MTCAPAFLTDFFFPSFWARQTSKCFLYCLLWQYIWSSACEEKGQVRAWHKLQMTSGSVASLGHKGAVQVSTQCIRCDLSSGHFTTGCIDIILLSTRNIIVKYHSSRFYRVGNSRLGKRKRNASHTTRLVNHRITPTPSLISNQNPSPSFSHLGPCEGLLGTGLLKRQICLEGCGPRQFLLAINGVYGTKGNTLLSWKLKVYMLEMKLNSI